MIKKRLEYQNDVSFYSIKNSTDAGDSLIEQSRVGDCEDFAHFFMRNFTMIQLYGKFLDPVNKCMQLIYKYYKPWFYICKIKMNGVIQFHCTMLLVPSNEKLYSISFEVTNPNKSYIVDSKDSDFFKWHVESYLLMNPRVIIEINNDDILNLNMASIYNLV